MIFGLFGKKTTKPVVPPAPLSAPEPEPTVHHLNIPSSFWIKVLSDDRKKIIYTMTTKSPYGKNSSEATMAFGDLPIIVKLEYDGEPKSTITISIEGPNFKAEGLFLPDTPPAGAHNTFHIGRFRSIYINPNGVMKIKSRWAGANYDEQALEELTTLRLLVE